MPINNAVTYIVMRLNWNKSIHIAGDFIKKFLLEANSH